MNPEEHYIEINRRSWNQRTQTHLESEFYNMEGFLKGASSLNEIELNLLGEVRGKTILHLQCHFGQDSISLSRLGAEVTGVDLSDQAIANARKIANETQSSARFICCDLYDLPNHLNQKFDLVFTSYGTIGWLPDLDKWANLIAQFLKPKGQLVFVEFHPVVWMFDDQFTRIAYRYFNSGPIVETQSGTYADREAQLILTEVSWNHSLSEVLNSLLKNGLALQSFEEFDYSPYNCFQGAIESEPGKFRIAHLNDQIPMVYAILAIRKGE